MSTPRVLLGSAVVATALLAGCCHASAQEPPPADAAGASEGDTVVLDRGLRLFAKEGRLEAQGVICLQRGLLELYGCGQGGKDHESIMAFPFRAQQLQLGLILLGLRDKHELGTGGGPKYQGDPARPVGDRVLLLIEWTGPDGKTESRRAEDLVLDRKTGQSAPRVGWVFAGSEFADEKDPGTGEPTGRKLYLANRYKVYIAIQHDPTAVLDYPLDAGANWAAARFFCNDKVIPPAGTKVKLIARAPTAEETAEMEKLEQEAVEAAAKEAKDEAARLAKEAAERAAREAGAGS
ncbi:MAG: hypothetical protein HZA54_18010 [Planctomycetes bacterium]|nr:hypothetical protein [Planctomycetota bacterium]